MSLLDELPDIPDLPYYSAWRHRKLNAGDWPVGIDRSWMRDPTGSYNESVVVNRVVQELAQAAAQAMRAKDSEPLGLTPTT